MSNIRRHNRPGASPVFLQKANGSASSSDPNSLIRAYTSDTNPSRPIRPSPLAASQIRGMPLDLLEKLRSFPLFQSAPEAFLVAIAKHLRPQQHSPKDYILTEGDDAKAMYWLVRGAVSVTSRDGESTYADLRQGSFFGEIGILMDIPRTATIIARSRCLLVVLLKEDLHKELGKFPEVEQALKDEAMERLAILKKKKREEGHAKMLARGPSKAEKRSLDVKGSDELGLELGRAAKRRKSPSESLSPLMSHATSALANGLVNVRQLLTELPLFAQLPPEILHFLGLSAQPKTFEPFKTIIQQDTAGKEVYFIVKGEVEVVQESSAPLSPRRRNKSELSTNGVASVKARLKQGQYFGEVTSLSLAPKRTATVRSVTQVECLMISGDVMNELWKRCSPDLRKQVEQTAKDRILENQDVEMDDGPVFRTPLFDDLQIGEARSPPMSPRRPPPTIQFNLDAGEVPINLTGEDKQGVDPFDPDPFLSTDLENMRSKSRRSSWISPSEDGDPKTTSPKHPSTLSGHRRATSLREKGLPSFKELVWAKAAQSPRRRSSQISQDDFSDPILLGIFKRLGLVDLMRFRRVSKHWNKLISSSNQIFRELDLSDCNRIVTDEALIKWICPFVGPRPRVIDISNCFHITDDGFSHLAAMCGINVRKWKMRSVWDVTAPAILEMATKAKQMEEVDLANCRKVNDGLLARMIGWIVHESHFAPPRKHGREKSRDKERADKEREKYPAPGTVIGCPQLRKITLSYCKHVTDRSMAHIAMHAADRLEEMDLTRCTTITDSGFQQWSMVTFPRLRKLVLADCTYLTDNAIVYLTNAAKGLSELDLSFCCALSDTAVEVLALSCSTLTSLNLSFCGSAVSDNSLRAIGLHLLELRHLSVRGCVRVTGNGVDSVVHGCSKLEEFDVSQCKNLVPWIRAGGIENTRQAGRHVRFGIVAGKGGLL